MDDELIYRITQAVESIAEYDDVGEYGYGGETYSLERISNWPEIIKTIITIVQDEKGMKDSRP
jgi:hypothetical protein